MKDAELEMFQRGLVSLLRPLHEAYMPEHVGVSYRPDLNTVYLYITNPGIEPDNDEIWSRGPSGNICIMFTNTKETDQTKYRRKGGVIFGGHLSFVEQGWELIRAQEDMQHVGVG